MKRFKTFLNEKITSFAGKKRGSTDIFRIIGGYNIILNSKTMSILQQPRQKEYYHITNLNGLDFILNKLQGRKKSISTSLQKPSQKIIKSGITEFSGVLVILDGDPIIIATTDIFSIPDDEGRRWSSYFDLFKIYNQSSKYSSFSKEIKNYSKKLIMELSSEISMTNNEKEKNKIEQKAWKKWIDFNYMILEKNKNFLRQILIDNLKFKKIVAGQEYNNVNNVDETILQNVKVKSVEFYNSGILDNSLSHKIKGVLGLSGHNLIHSVKEILDKLEKDGIDWKVFVGKNNMTKKYKDMYKNDQYS